MEISLETFYVDTGAFKERKLINEQSVRRFGARGTYLKRDAHSVLLALRGAPIEEKSLRHVTKVAKFIILNEPWSCKYGRKNEKIDMHNFLVRGHSHFLNFSPGVSSKLLRLSKHIDRALGVMGLFYHFQPSCFPYIKLITLQPGRS